MITYGIPTLTTTGHGLDLVTTVEASHIRPGMTVDLYGDRVNVTAWPVWHADGGSRVMVGPYAVPADYRVTVAGWFNAEQVV